MESPAVGAELVVLLVARLECGCSIPPNCSGGVLKKATFTFWKLVYLAKAFEAFESVRNERHSQTPTLLMS